MKDQIGVLGRRLHVAHGGLPASSVVTLTATRPGSINEDEGQARSGKRNEWARGRHWDRRGVVLDRAPRSLALICISGVAEKVDGSHGLEKVVGAF